MKCWLLLGYENLVPSSSRSPFLLVYAKHTHMRACGYTHVSEGGHGAGAGDTTPGHPPANSTCLDIQLH